MSDVKNFVQSMLATRKSQTLSRKIVINKATEANHVVREGKLKKGSIVRLKQYQANSVKSKRFVIATTATRELTSAAEF
jgi:replication factor A1